METARLILRQWRESDRAPFAALNADPEVMAFFPRTLDREESDALADRLRAGIDERGHGFWAVEVRGGPFVGFVGLQPVRPALTLAPAYEVGWRLARQHWGHGYATEAGAASLAYGFDEIGLDEIVAYAVARNVRSIAVMERLGMSHDPERDFEDKSFPAGHPHRPAVVYRAQRPGSGGPVRG